MGATVPLWTGGGAILPPAPPTRNEPLGALVSDCGGPRRAGRDGTRRGRARDGSICCRRSGAAVAAVVAGLRQAIVGPSHASSPCSSAAVLAHRHRRWPTSASTTTEMR
eukprot:scaffold2754_cov388-Prasinococcus_capsulatus_cf.AAC.8